MRLRKAVTGEDAARTALLYGLLWLGALFGSLVSLLHSLPHSLLHALAASRLWRYGTALPPPLSQGDKRPPPHPSDPHPPMDGLDKLVD